MTTVTLADIQAARTRLGDDIYHSPCPYSLSLSRLTGAEIYCKLDHLQHTGSFKERGARNKLLLLTPEEKERGVICASAGNHALGLSYHGQLLGVKVTVVMPKWAPLVKVSNCRANEAEIILHGESYDQAKKHALELSASTGKTYIPGFDDPAIIAGAGTMGLEILEDVPDVDAVIIPVGGGGLVAGAGLAIKAIKPSVRVIAVETENAPTFKASLDAGRVVRIDTRPTLADGLAIAEIGKLPFEIARKVIDELVMVDEEQVARAILRLMEHEKLVVEGAGAVPLAAVMRRPHGLEGKKVVLCLCGGNIDVTVIGRIIERGMAADGRLCRIVASIDDRPGGLVRLLNVIAAAGASVKEVEHDRHFGPADIAKVTVRVVMETRDAQHVAEVHEAIRQAGIGV
ncbi:threonine ammonia-lyase [Humisphaera borealis]|uniref:Threonine ammonia-lyase n=1 Tax=Humisphaera borealis TaxID=2807512 RepID=A0A7M2WY58_9BACT|nr:threonine ammonia-lyase [Humisphaera borealis]QOV90162.1 threonine ammonia-lyase [Humisphaera borealis]